MARTAGLPQEVAGFPVVSLLGRGGMGTVYLVRHPRMGRLQALKVVRTGWADDDQLRERFLREAEIASRVEHPALVTIYDQDERDGELHLSMQWVDGTDLGRLVHGDHRFDVADVASGIAQVASALDAVHAADLVHRDVKPSNVLVARRRAADGTQRWYLADFGIARALDETFDLTGQGFVGSVPYCAPECFDGHRGSVASDVYSLACVAVEAFTGSPPFGRSPAVVMGAHSRGHGVPTLPGLPEAVAEVLRRGLATDPARRPASAGELAAELTAAVSRSAEALRGGPERIDESVTVIAKPRARAGDETVTGQPAVVRTDPVRQETDVAVEAPGPPVTRSRFRRVLVAALLAVVVVAAGLLAAKNISSRDGVTSVGAEPPTSAPQPSAEASSDEPAPSVTAVSPSAATSPSASAAPLTDVNPFEQPHLSSSEVPIAATWNGAPESLKAECPLVMPAALATSWQTVELQEDNWWLATTPPDVAFRDAPGAVSMFVSNGYPDPIPLSDLKRYDHSAVWSDGSRVEYLSLGSPSNILFVIGAFPKCYYTLAIEAPQSVSEMETIIRSLRFVDTA